MRGHDTTGEVPDDLLLAKIFNAMVIDTHDVLEAAGLVGGHCIGVDPYYLIQKAQIYGILSRVIVDGRL